MRSVLSTLAGMCRVVATHQHMTQHQFTKILSAHDAL
jgi:hypothetical protein